MLWPNFLGLELEEEHFSQMYHDECILGLVTVNVCMILHKDTN